MSRDRWGGDYIYNVLYNDTVVAALTTAIYEARMVPITESSYDTINYYVAGTVDYTLPRLFCEWSIDCRSKSEYTSKEIAQAAIAALNRENASFGGYKYYGTCRALPTIPPIDAQDCFNTPVTFTMRRH